jgi:hypothetical protein
MPVRISQTISRLHPAARRRGYRAPNRTEEPPTTHPLAPEARVREAGGPEDHAHYTCCCGMVFSASVSASVRCPACGVDQDW